MRDTVELAREIAAQRDRTRCLMGMPDSSWCGNCRCGARIPLPDVHLVDDELTVDSRPQPAQSGGRCRCRASCLSLIEPGDLIVHSDVGWLLADHAATATVPR